MKVKNCSNCKQTKPHSEFGRNVATKDGLQYHCKQCRNAYLKTWYSENKDLQKSRVQKNTKKKVDDRRNLIREIKESTPCADCGILYPPYVMDFDHLPGSEKITSISSLSQGWRGSVEILKAEILKCELVCANCHRIRTHKRRVNAGKPKGEAPLS